MVSLYGALQFLRFQNFKEVVCMSAADVVFPGDVLEQAPKPTKGKPKKKEDNPFSFKSFVKPKVLSATYIECVSFC